MTGKKKKFDFSVRQPYREELKSLIKICDEASYQWAITHDEKWLEIYESTKKKIIELKEKILAKEEKLFVKD